MLPSIAANHDSRESRSMPDIERVLYSSWLLERLWLLATASFSPAVSHGPKLPKLHSPQSSTSPFSKSRRLRSGAVVGVKYQYKTQVIHTTRAVQTKPQG